MRPHSGPFLSFLAYYMGAPSDQFLHLLWRPPYVFFFHTIWSPSDHFFAYYIGAPRSLSSLTIWGPSDQFLLIQYGGPSQISFIVYYTGLPLRSVSLHAIGGPPHILVFSPNIWGPSDQFLSLLYGPRVTIGLVYLPTIYGVPSYQFLCILFGGPSQISFFSYYSNSFFIRTY